MPITTRERAHRLTRTYDPMAALRIVEDRFTREAWNGTGDYWRRVRDLVVENVVAGTAGRDAALGRLLSAVVIADCSGVDGLFPTHALATVSNLTSDEVCAYLRSHGDLIAALCVRHDSVTLSDAGLLLHTEA